MSITLRNGVNTLTLNKGSLNVGLEKGTRKALLNKTSNTLRLSSSANQVFLSDKNKKITLTPLSINQRRIIFSPGSNEFILTEENNQIELLRETRPVTIKKGLNYIDLNLNAVLKPTQIATFIVDAYCKATDEVDDLVYVKGDMTGDKFQVEKCEITNRNKMPAWAIIISKSSPIDCKVQWFGMVTGFTGLTSGDIYYVGEDSKITNVIPTPTLNHFYIQKIGEAVDDEILLLKPSLEMVKIIP